MFIQLGVAGNVRLRVRDHQTGVVREWRQSNTITSGGLALLRDYLLQADPAAAPTPPSFMAVGSGVIVDSGYYLTRLRNEQARQAIVQRDSEGLSVVYHSYFEPTDANGAYISTFGLFARDANNVANTGTLLAVVNNDAPFWKTAIQSFQADWVITLSGRMSAG